MGGVDYRWRLRERMAQQGIFSASELAPHLAAHGVRLSSSQVWRLVTGRPERLNLRTLVVLCEILDCTPNDLIEQVEAASEQPKRAAAGRAAGKEIGAPLRCMWPRAADQARRGRRRPRHVPGVLGARSA